MVLQIGYNDLIQESRINFTKYPKAVLDEQNIVFYENITLLCKENIKSL
jgi:phenolic acid decarboxylase